MTEPPINPDLVGTDRLLWLIDAMADKPVLMVVDLVADRFITGTPKRISREAPVLILRFEEEKLIPGGGANAVANVRALGGRPLPLGIVGDDQNGEQLLKELQRQEISTDGILVRPGYLTPTKTRILGGGKHSIKQQIVRFDIEEILEQETAEQVALSLHLKSLTGTATVAVFSDYGYGGVRPALIPEVRKAISRSASEPGTILCDSRYRLEEFSGMDGATPNEEEAEALLGEALDDDQERLFDGGRRLLKTLKAGFLLITRGSRGMALFEAQGVWHLPVHGTDQVADVTGAGDTVIGTFALALAAGATALEAACLANYAGGVVVMKMGTATLDPKELRRAVEANPSLLEEARWVKS